MKRPAEDGTTAAMLCLLAFSAIFGLLPLALYGWARLTGALPSEAEWSVRGGNHGPWWIEPEGMVILHSFLLLLLMMPITVIVSITCSAIQRRVSPFFTGLALVVVQVLLAFAGMRYLIWTID